MILNQFFAKAFAMIMKLIVLRKYFLMPRFLGQTSIMKIKIKIFLNMISLNYQKSGIENSI